MKRKLVCHQPAETRPDQVTATRPKRNAFRTTALLGVAVATIAIWGLGNQGCNRQERLRPEQMRIITKLKMQLSDSLGALKLDERMIAATLKAHADLVLENADPDTANLPGKVGMVLRMYNQLSQAEQDTIRAWLKNK